MIAFQCHNAQTQVTSAPGSLYQDFQFEEVKKTEMNVTTWNWNRFNKDKIKLYWSHAGEIK